jgi:hypothetical protein
MKNLTGFLLFVALSGIVFLYSCNDDSDEPAKDPPTITATPNAVEGRDGDMISVSVAWSADAEVDGITSSSANATVTAPSGTSGTFNSTITVQAGGETITYTITDKAGKTATSQVVVTETANPKPVITVEIGDDDITSGTTANITTADEVVLSIGISAADGLKSVEVTVDQGDAGTVDGIAIGGTTATGTYTYAPMGQNLVGQMVTHTIKAVDEEDDITEFTVITDISKGTVTINDQSLLAGTTYQWYQDVEYLCDGLVYLEFEGVLKIEPGTLIKFKKTPSSNDNTSALIITQGARIEAEGTKESPIVFTAELDDGSLTAADNQQWGGIIVLGYAPAYKKGNTVIQIEGIPSTEPRGQYGGNQPNDNSGILKYVSIRYTGIGLAPGDEIQGLTLGGVGSGTMIDYIDIYSSSDDGIEIFGGTVDIRHISVAFATDDSFDFDLGWLGTGQFLFALQGEDTPGFDHGGEWDGASPDDAPLFSAPQLANMTIIGPGSTGTLRDKAILMRENFAGSLYNSLLTDFPEKGIEVQDMGDENGDLPDDCYERLTQAKANDDGNSYQIVIANNTWSKFGSASAIADIVKATSIKDDNENTIYSGQTADVVAHLINNTNAVVTTDVVKSISRVAGSGGLDPRPQNEDSNIKDLSNVSDKFETANYRGAFSATDNWLEGWSTLAVEGYFPGN